ncbi:YjjG family noncanonical pyrimidine nucleotidase [Pseudolactococcus plantarum]|uniref:Haloacid dehalogenase n=1 Tax=Pseudolactococcus plantarum TaxID=1365 RepID=A0A2A5RYF5_9LACT|nr:YjjG family noncanonical pyrimidine nucleotidase [Lactococcus plantarum]PCS06287.1 haloacid dehalogenase [Lactococcus plantarum]HCN75492.1 noncanonical pyrimidine nucleotidase, YjjG family [Lactococcus sp.]
MNYKVLIFDLDDTILDFKAGEKKGLKAVFDTFQKSALDYDAWVSAYKKINADIWQQIELGKPAQPLLNERFSKTFAQFDQEIDGAQAEATYRQVLDVNDAVMLGAKDLLDGVKQEGYQLVVGTNGKTNTQYNRLALTGFDAYFDEVVISQEIGHVKPSSSFFAHIFKLYPKYDKANFLMIGDTLTSDIQGANQAGIDSVWLDHGTQHDRLSQEHKPTYRVKDLAQIKALLA